MADQRLTDFLRATSRLEMAARGLVNGDEGAHGCLVTALCGFEAASGALETAAPPMLVPGLLSQPITEAATRSDQRQAIIDDLKTLCDL